MVPERSDNCRGSLRPNTRPPFSGRESRRSYECTALTNFVNLKTVAVLAATICCSWATWFNVLRDNYGSHVGLMNFIGNRAQYVQRPRIRTGQDDCMHSGNLCCYKDYSSSVPTLSRPNCFVPRSSGLDTPSVSFVSK